MQLELPGRGLWATEVKRSRGASEKGFFIGGEGLGVTRRFVVNPVTERRFVYKNLELSGVLANL